MDKKYRVYLAANVNSKVITAALTEGVHKALPVMLLPDHCNIYDPSHTNTVAIVIAAYPQIVGGHPYEPENPENEPSPGQILAFVEQNEMPEPIYTPANPNMNLPTLTMEGGHFFVNVQEYFLPKHLKDEITWEKEKKF